MTTELRGKYHEFALNMFEGGYWQANGYATAVVARVIPGVCWSAFIGGGPLEHERECLEVVAEGGVKLRENHARAFFPEETLPYRD